MSDREYQRDDQGEFAGDGSSSGHSDVKKSNAILSAHGHTPSAAIGDEGESTHDPEELENAADEVHRANKVLSKYGQATAKLIGSGPGDYGSSVNADEAEETHRDVSRTNKRLTAIGLHPGVSVRLDGNDPTPSHDIDAVNDAIDTLKSFRKSKDFGRAETDEEMIAAGKALTDFGYTPMTIVALNFGDREYQRDGDGRFAGGSSGGSGSVSKAASGVAISASQTANASGSGDDHASAGFAHQAAAASHMQSAEDSDNPHDHRAHESIAANHKAAANEHFKKAKEADSRSKEFGDIDPAMIFNGSVGFAEKSITITARTCAEAFQGYWGRCIHDFAGFRMPVKSVPLDYNHAAGEAIGFADKFSIVDGELIAKGSLIPFKADDQASKVIFQGAKGVPFQASIVMDPAGLDVERVSDGKTVQVNGGYFTGPGTVFRKWGINGIAICPYGSDSETSVKFSRGQPPSVPPVLKEETMTEKKVETETKIEDGKPPVVPPVAIEKPAENPDNFSRSTALKFSTDFGPQGFDWYLSGKSYEEAAKLFGASIQGKLDAAEAALKAKDDALSAAIKERDDFKKKSEFHRGQVNPVPVKPTEEEVAKVKADAMKFGRTPGQQALIDAVSRRMPKPSVN